MSQGAEPWTVEVSGEARRGLHRLPPKIASAVVEFATGPLARNPERLSKPLRGDLVGTCSARRGDYRVLIHVDEATHTVLIIRVDHRADVYRQR